MRRIESGNEALDQILGGGFPVNSTNLLMGMPGTGKTVLAQSIAFHNASAARPVLYISTVSEPLDRMLRYVQEFDYFDAAQIGEAIIYQELSEPLRTRGLVAAVDELVTLIKRYRPSFLVIDSFKALHSFTDSEQEFRASLAVLTSVLSSLAITSFWVGEYGPDEVPNLPEFAVTDSVVELVLDRIGVRDVRYLRVTKLRGSAFFGGQHAFRIGSAGIELFPRLITPDVPVDYELAVARSATGVPALDAMLSAGLWKGSSTLAFGPPGSGKTLLGLHFIFKGIEMGERGLIATMQENPTQLQRIAQGFGWDVQAAIASGMLILMYVSPVEHLHRRVREPGLTARVRGRRPARADRQRQRPAGRLAERRPLSRLHVLAHSGHGRQRRLHLHDPRDRRPVRHHRALAPGHQPHVRQRAAAQLRARRLADQTRHLSDQDQGERSRPVDPPVLHHF